MVGGLAPAAALSKDLPVFEACDDVFDVGADTSVRPPVVVADDPAAVNDPWPVITGVGGPQGVGEHGIRWWMMRSMVDWLVVNSAASARVVRFVRK